MIRAVYDKLGPAITVQGHAGAASYGSDVVCAGVSTLVFTLMHELIRLGIEHKREFQPGYARLETKGEAQASFDCVATGLMLISESYPDCVSFTMAGDQWSPLRDTKEHQ